MLRPGGRSSKRPPVLAVVLRWGARVDRPLPWRGERDPYRVLVSEVMLQQTQASRVIASYTSFLQRFPTAAALAAARESDVLREWGSLGYNRRALQLRRAAQSVVRHGWPADLTQLPGVGPYTAAAVAAFAFGRDVAAVDANVRRVIGRIYAIPPREVAARAQALLPRGRAARWNQALMDLGALVCRPRTPDCGGCPARRGCRFAAGERVPPASRAPSEKFEETTRYARGRVVAALRAAATLRTADLVAATGLDRARFARAAEALQRDGLISRGADRRWRLGRD